MNERIRKLVRTNTVAYILLLLLFAAVTAKDISGSGHRRGGRCLGGVVYQSPAE